MTCLYQPFPMQGVRRGQIWRYAPQYRRPRHFHNEPELNLIVAGRATFGTGDSVLSVAPRDLLCWPPGCDHELIEASTDFDLYVIGLTPELSSRVLGDGDAKVLAGPLQVQLSPPDFAELQLICALPIADLDVRVVEQYVAEFWQKGHALRGKLVLERPASDSVSSRVMASLLADPGLSRSERARIVRAYPTEVSRNFHRDMGTTLTEYRTRLRLLEFIEVVDRGDSTLLAAALEAGFGSYSQCHRSFRRTLGCTPRHFFDYGIRRDMSDVFSPLPANC